MSSEGEVTQQTEQVATQAAETAIAGGASEAQVQAAVRSALEAYQPRLSDEDVDRIAKAQIKHLEDRGAFEEPEPDPTHASGNSGTQEPNTNSSLSTVPIVDEPPKKKTWAQKFLKVEDL